MAAVWGYVLVLVLERGWVEAGFGFARLFFELRVKVVADFFDCGEVPIDKFNSTRFEGTLGGVEALEDGKGGIWGRSCRLVL